MDEKKVREAIYCMKASIGETMCEDEYCLWYDEHGIYDGVIFAWQPLPEPYKEV